MDFTLGWTPWESGTNQTVFGTLMKSGCRIFQHKSKVIGVANEPAFQLVPGEKGQTTTILAFVSTSGLKTQQMIIFKGEKVPKEWCKAAPTGVYVRTSLGVYINAKLFAE